MKVVERKLGTSTLKFQFISLSNNRGEIIFCGPPKLALQETENSLSLAMFDLGNLDAIVIKFQFAKNPKCGRAKFGAAKIITRHLLRIMRQAEITEVGLYFLGKEKISAAAKSGLELLKKAGIKIS